MIERTFQNISKDGLTEASQRSFLISLGWSRGATWDCLLRSKRVLIISEAGAGKTYECREQAQRLWNAGEPSFFIELTALASTDLRSLFDDDEEARLDTWLSSQSDVATFFLDSIDELKLSRGSFEQALKRLKKGVKNQLRRARIVITTRPIPFDEQLVRRVLPIPPPPPVEPKEEIFARIAMGDQPSRQAEGEEDTVAADWRLVALMPLSDEQIEDFAGGQGVEDPSALMDDLRKRNGQEFARRPQDLIELCADWHVHKRIRMHRDQVVSNVRLKLQARDDRPEPAELSVDKAIDGASRLALAMLVTRRLTIRHSAASDAINDEGALDPSTILSDWNPDERKALLERPLYGFASYGRVRFHHHSILEYLAAQRLLVLRSRGMPIRALRRLLFAQTRGKTIVRPSLRPMAGWLALDESNIFEMLRDNEPAVLLDEGDPEALTQSQRNQALRAYVEHYGVGGWRGLSVPHIQIHRFASPELADEVNRLWCMGVENPEVRQTLLSLIEAGRIVDSAELAHNVVRDVSASEDERILAIDAMVALADPRLEEIAAEVSAGGSLWPDNIARGAIIMLFPQYLSISQLCEILSSVKERKQGAGELSWQLPRLIANVELDTPSLEELRDGLVELVSVGLRWDEEWQPFVCDRPHLSEALSATCVRGLAEDTSEEWLSASVLAHRLHDNEYGKKEAREGLHERLEDLPADQNARLFWNEDSLLQSLLVITDPWSRFARITLSDGPVKLRTERDLSWIKEALSNTARDANDRALLLEAAISLSPSREEWRDHVSGLKALVEDQPGLLAAIDERLKPSKYDNRHEHWERKQAEQKKQREQQEKEDRASWIQFWREVAEHPESAFSSERSENTAWNLWRAMSYDGENSRTPGWNRRFIEDQFGKETADRLRRELMDIWRKDYPTLASERAADKRNTYSSSWQLGLAAIYAEAEDPEWATKLSEEEAELAARYATIELNGLPLWIESLASAHTHAVDITLGEELSWELAQSANEHGHSMLLQNVGNGPVPVAKVFLPRLRTWLEAGGDVLDNSTYIAKTTLLLRQVIGALLKHGDEDMHTYLLSVARKHLNDDLPTELVCLWLSTLIQIDPELGISSLEDRVREIEPAERSEAVTWFSVIFWDPYDTSALKTFTPQLLLRLSRLAYHHVRVEDDAEHEGCYTPNTRDDAESARNNIVNALFNCIGKEGWAVKLEMAANPACSHFKDRILAVAEESWAQEIDSIAFDESQAVALDNTGEAPGSTNGTMFAILNDRLADLDDLLLSDSSPREAWAGITDEKIMRREIARELKHAANGLYTVDQEAVTADEKETDIRLRSVVSNHEAVIELKLADGRSARDLRDTIYDQLVRKYMAAENSRSGCLLVTLAKDRRWKHPESGDSIGLTDLNSILRNEAKRVEEAMCGSVSQVVYILDLRPRLPKENANCIGDERI